jgi:hypothetical protein
MKDSRVGESLWSEWSGRDHHPDNSLALVFYTEGHVELDVEVVKRALASTVQRDGHTDSLAQAFKALDGASVVIHTYAGELDGDPELTKCDAYGMTIYEDTVDEVIPITLVEINV